jgi:hypothetical protein
MPTADQAWFSVNGKPLVYEYLFDLDRFARKTAELATGVQPTRLISTGTGLTGGGDLSADRTISVQFGTIAGTVAEGNDSRIVGAAQASSLGTAAYAAVGDFDASGTASTAVAAHVAATDPHPQYLTSAEGNAAYQQLDADLTAIAALSTASYGRSLLTALSASAASISLGTVRRIKRTIFRSSGTFTADANAITTLIEAVGGGGGGGGVSGTSGQLYQGGGGGGGCFMSGLFTPSQIGASKSITIGAGGVGGVGAANGGNGGDSFVDAAGALLLAGGGLGGKYGSSSQVGVGGAGSSNGSTANGAADYGVVGSPGGSGLYNAVNANIAFSSGNGGSAHLGGGAQGVAGAGSIAGNNASGFGGGGSGASSNGSGTLTANGGDGKTGLVIVTEYCTS